MYSGKRLALVSVREGCTKDNTCPYWKHVQTRLDDVLDTDGDDDKKFKKIFCREDCTNDPIWAAEAEHLHQAPTRGILLGRTTPPNYEQQQRQQRCTIRPLSLEIQLQAGRQLHASQQFPFGCMTASGMTLFYNETWRTVCVFQICFA